MPSPASVSFDRTNPRAVAYARDHAAALLVGIDDASREAVNAVIRRCFDEHVTPAAAARLIRASVGLTRQQADALLNLYQKIRTSPGALVYAGDVPIRVPEDGMDEELLQQRVDEYSDRLLNDRAETIARTEVLAASNAGQQELWLQAVDEGLLTGDELREWIWTELEMKDGKFCERCEAMDGQAVGLNEPFVSPEGDEVMNPPLHPRCRCGQGVSDRTREDVQAAQDEEAQLVTESALEVLGGLRTAQAEKAWEQSR
jgi:hypothetical protein